MKTLVPIMLQVSLLLVVASVGLRAHWRDVLAAMRRSGMLIRGVLAVNVVVPVTAVLLCTLLPMVQPIKIGIVIMAVSPLAPLLTGKMLRAGVDASVTVGLYVALVTLAVFIVPATIALLSWIYPGDASISVAAVAGLTAKSVLAPLVAGLIVGTLVPGVSHRLAKLLATVGYAGLALVAIAILYARGADILALVGNGAVLAIIATVIAGLIAGHLLGGADAGDRTALALAASARHPGLAALIAQQNFADPKVPLATMLFLLTSIVVSAGYLAWVRRQSQTPAEAAAA